MSARRPQRVEACYVVWVVRTAIILARESAGMHRLVDRICEDAHHLVDAALVVRGAKAVSTRSKGLDSARLIAESYCATATLIKVVGGKAALALRLTSGVYGPRTPFVILDT